MRFLVYSPDRWDIVQDGSCSCMALRNVFCRLNCSYSSWARQKVRHDTPSPQRPSESHSDISSITPCPFTSHLGQCLRATADIRNSGTSHTTQSGARLTYSAWTTAKSRSFLSARIERFVRLVAISSEKSIFARSGRGHCFTMTRCPGRAKECCHIALTLLGRGVSVPR